jgi:hypothetical protein
LLAKVLARRLRPVQGEVIGREQTAFLPGRLMGDNVMLLQLLPSALPISSYAAAVYLDIRKAYDTISRPFLYQLLQAAGLGEGFLTWVRLLLDDTASCVCVNGHTSRMVPFTAGVRQGCPLAPQLYLFVAQALLLFLKSCGFGVRVGERVLTANQFADDCQVFLESPAEVPLLLQWWDVFRVASGQALNCHKTQVMLLGKAAQREWWVYMHLQWLAAQLQEHQALHLVEGLQPLPSLAWEAPSRYVRADMRGPARALPVFKVGRDRWGQWAKGVPGATQLHQQLFQCVAQWLLSHRGQVIPVAQLAGWVSAAVDVQLVDDPTYFPEGAQEGGLSLVGKAKALGLVHTVTGESQADWRQLLQLVEERYATISRLPLSMFGRAFAASGYGLSRLCFAAEFVPVPDASVLDRLSQLTAKLVDRGLAPEAPGRKFAGIKAELLVGHPKLGACGVLPLLQHIRARHAKWALRLCCATGDEPWVHVARHCLVPPALRACPAWQHLVLPASNAASEQEPGAVVLPCVDGHLPPALKRLVQALQALPEWEDVATEPLTPGLWCHNAPLWCNPYLAAGDLQHALLPWRGLEARFGLLANLGTINTVADALQAWDAVHTGYGQYRQQLWPFWFGSNPAFASWEVADDMMTALVGTLNMPVVQAVRSMTLVERQHAPPSADVCAMLMARLGWRLPGGKPRTLSSASVRLLTALQMPQAHVEMRLRQETFAAHVSIALPAPMTGVTAQEVRKCMLQVWKLPWDNKRKEVLWRLVYDAFPTAARMPGKHMPCPCGVAVPDRQHHFWLCPVARAVVTELQSQMPFLGPAALQQVHVWLSRVPANSGLHKGVWRVVCLAAMHGMHKGMQVLAAWAMHQQEGQVMPGHLCTPAQRVLAAAKIAVATLWDMVQDFVSLRMYPATWLTEVGEQHPFVCCVVNAQHCAVLCIRRRYPAVPG